MSELRVSFVSKVLRAGIMLVMALLLTIPQPALAQTNAENGTAPNGADKKPKIDFSDNDVNWYDPRGNNVCGATFMQSSGDTITKFLQALAKQESGGNIKAVSGTGAKGKYQYIDSTWRSHAAQYYPPASKYATALDAPEEYQDAVAYIEYAVKNKQFNGDLFKLAVSHFYPAANSDPSLLDITPPGNVVTPRQYAQQFIQKINSGAGKEIPIKAAQAPEFQTYLQKATNGAVNSTLPNNDTCASSNGVAAGDIVKTALGLAWPDSGHGKNKGDATPAYQTAMPKFNPSSAAASNDPWSDCGVFVATTIRSSGTDTSYQARGTASQISYIRQHPEKFDYFTTSDYTQSTEKLQPGDILIRNGHTYLFTGPYKGSDGKLYNSASASWHDHVPQATNWYKGFNVARAKK